MPLAAASLASLVEQEDSRERALQEVIDRPSPNKVLDYLNEHVADNETAKMEAMLMILRKKFPNDREEELKKMAEDALRNLYKKSN